jgi:hypothetical protein
MTPAQLKTTDFDSYPRLARQVASGDLELFRHLPLVFAAVLLREIIAYDWRFPAERRQIDGQLRLLGKLPPPELAQKMAGFNSLRLNSELERTGWVTNPSGFMEQLTAWLWSTHQMDGFRQTADLYASYLSDALPVPEPASPRLGIVVVGQGVDKAEAPLFRKLRPNGVYLTQVKPEGGLEVLLSAAAKRGAAGSEGFAHWYIDGGTPLPAGPLTQISYAGLERPRSLLLERTQRAIQSGSMGPEGLRSLLAQMKPEDVGLQGPPGTSVLNHFQMTLLTEGSGTQIFATTFAQWAARECLRRAQPETLVVRYAPRQELQPMNEMLSGAKAGVPDPQGSLVDADMGSYYTWINMTRLPGANRLRFLVWFEGHREAVVIGPGLPRGTTSDSVMDMRQVLGLLA